MENRDETVSLISAGKVQGSSVYNTDGDSLGEVYDVMIDKLSGKFAYAIMSFGGVLGVGERYHPLPWNTLKYDTRSFKELEDISEEEWDLTFRVNIHAMFYLTKAPVPHMKPGSAIINTASINSDMPNPTLLAYATTKGAIPNFPAGLAQLLASKGIRANAVAPGPIWTPLIPSTCRRKR
jgi:NAD(P)-dependent dehydrogenase (short-subunit alcohol dehydrogenase family)